MKLSNQKIEEFQKIHLSEFGEEIDKREAQRQAIQLLQLVKRIYRPITQKEFNKYKLQKYENANSK